MAQIVLSLISAVFIFKNILKFLILLNYLIIYSLNLLDLNLITKFNQLIKNWN